MSIHFESRGRLGNAIFRYLACSILSIHFDLEYQSNGGGSIGMNDHSFHEISNRLLKDETVHVAKNAYRMPGYYQHDEIYKKYKKEICNYIKEHPLHEVSTDGINAGDGRREYFKMIHILNTPTDFQKRYTNVLHVRLEDFVTHNLFASTERIINLCKKNIVKNTICIVCKEPTTEFEKGYLKELNDFFISKNIHVTFEHNDVLTDYYIMKEAETLICSKSTLSWCAAFFSDKIKKCYLVDYEIQPQIMTCKKPIDNTILY